MNVLLSIKPEFAEKILADEKRYEFRRAGFRDESLVDIIIMYASSPVQQIVGIFTINNVIETNPERLWNQFGSESGISKQRFMKYFAGTEEGYAIEVGESHRLSSPVDPWNHFDQFRPPVSFQYVNGEFDFLLERYDFPKNMESPSAAD